MERIQLALYQPDIPQNTGTLLRLAACLGLGVDIIEPCGFVLTDKHFKRAGMDYLDRADLTRHVDFPAFLDRRRGAEGRRVVLLTTRAETLHWDFAFRPGDVLLLGRESAGVPGDVAQAADACIKVPMVTGARSLNVAVAGAMVAGEALRQIRTQDV